MATQRVDMRDDNTEHGASRRVGKVRKLLAALGVGAVVAGLGAFAADVASAPSATNADSLTWTAVSRPGGIQLTDDSLTWTSLGQLGNGVCAQTADDDSLTWTGVTRPGGITLVDDDSLTWTAVTRPGGIQLVDDSLTWTAATRPGGIQLADDSLTWTSFGLSGPCGATTDDDSLTWTSTIRPVDDSLTWTGATRGGSTWTFGVPSDGVKSV